MTIYQDMKAANIPIDNHESDLYVRDCKKARDILAEHDKRGKRVCIVDGWNVSKFYNQIDGEPWLDIPFAYDPFYDNRRKTDV
jgi:hypothetical protein